MRISEIVIGDRVRKDMGDLRELADSIGRHGLLHPVVVTRENVLVAGHRRIEAVKLLGALDIAATVVDVDDLLSAERDENEVRKDWTPTEAVAIGKLIEEQHRPRIEAQRSAIGRQNVAKRRDRVSADVKETTLDPIGKTDAAAARAVGVSVSTYQRAKAVVAAAEAEPEKFGDLPALMDETGNVSGTHREMERRKSNGTNGRLLINRKTSLPNADREIGRLAIALEGLALSASAIKPGMVSKAKAGEWAESIRGSLKQLRKLLAVIEGV